jgi:hypothetical protein
MCQQCGNNICGGCQQPIIPSGINGVDGINAFNFTTGGFPLPAVNSEVSLNVKAINPFKNSWFAVGQIVFIETAGYFQVVSITGTNQVRLKNLGYSDTNFTPPAQGAEIPFNSKISPAGLIGATGATGGAGTPGTTRIAYSLPDILSGSGGTGASKTFITQPILAIDMPQTEGSSLLLTFNVRTENTNSFFLTRNIGITFGGQSCVIGTASLANRVAISDSSGFETQIKVEIIRASISTQAYARVSYYGISSNFSNCYNESNLLSGLNFGIQNDFVIFGRQNLADTFRFSLLTVDKITAQ